MRIIEDTPAFEAIAACTTCLLVIIFNRLGNIVMDHKPDIGFVNTHPECDGSTDHLHIFVEKLVLPVGPQLAIETSMVSHGLDAIRYQDIGELFSRPAIKSINDPAFIFHSLDEPDNVLICLVLLDLGKYLIIKIGPVERRNINVRIMQIQVLDDIALDFGSSCCCM